MKKKIWIIAAVIAILGIVPVSLKAQESTPRVVSTEAELEKAIKDEVSSVKLGKDITIGGTSTDEPFIIDSDIVIDGDGNSLALRKSGIVLGGKVTFKKMNVPSALMVTSICALVTMWPMGARGSSLPSS